MSDNKWYEREHHKKEYDGWKWPGYDPEKAIKEVSKKERNPMSLSQRFRLNLILTLSYPRTTWPLLQTARRLRRPHGREKMKRWK